jgi:hypothetical protein
MCVCWGGGLFRPKNVQWEREVHTELIGDGHCSYVSFKVWFISFDIRTVFHNCILHYLLTSVKSPLKFTREWFLLYLHLSSSFFRFVNPFRTLISFPPKHDVTEQQQWKIIYAGCELSYLSVSREARSHSNRAQCGVALNYLTFQISISAFTQRKNSAVCISSFYYLAPLRLHSHSILMRTSGHCLGTL